MAKLGIDIDGVLYQFEAQARRTLRQLGDKLPEPLSEAQKRNLIPMSTTWFRMRDIVGPVNFDWMWRHAAELGLYVYGPVHGENFFPVRELAERHEVFLVTSRPREVRRQTYEWAAVMDLNVAGIIHATNKVEVAMGMGITVVADDRDKELVAYQDWANDHHTRIWIYGVRRPWNQELHNDPGITWVDNLAEMAKDEEKWT